MHRDAVTQVRPLSPLNFKTWIDDHRHLLVPPVGNRQIWQDREFMVTVVGGPNRRNDFHVNEGEEFFYQLEGAMTLRLLEDGAIRDMPIGAGEIFLLPPKVPHSPQRPAGSVGLVIERRRLQHEIDAFLWLCERCHAPTYSESFHLTDLVSQLPPVFARYEADPAHRRCKACGHRNEVSHEA